MKVSTKGKYGLNAMVDIAMHSADGPVSLSAVAKRQNISMAYLEQLIVPLKKGGLVVSVRGAQGGYRLARAPEKIRVGEILRTLEEIFVASCESERTAACPDDCRKCPSKPVWDKLSEKLNDALDSLTLGDLCTMYRKNHEQLLKEEGE